MRPGLHVVFEAKMWSLWKHNSNEVFFKLLCDGQYNVGRKDAAILIETDQSVSRQHALFSTSAVLSEDITAKPLLRLKDLGSKYGTTVNNRRLGKDEKALQHGDIVTFGQLGSTYEVRYEEPMIVASSCLKPDRKKLLKEHLSKLGARLMQEWTPNCTHLVMDAITLTVKTACALLAVKPIVTPTFFQDTIMRIQEGHWQHLNTSDYIPSICEQSLRVEKESFDRNPTRRTLFQGKVFYFFNKCQYKKLHLALVSGGGKVVLVEGDGDPKDVYASPEACVMRPLEGVDHPVAKYLSQRGLRIIPESDIGLAVAYCSTEKFCNPRSTVASNFWQNTTLQSQCLSQSDVYAAESEQSQSQVSLAALNTNMTTRTILETRPSTLSVTPDRQHEVSGNTAGETILRSSLAARDSSKSPFTVTKGGSPIKLSSGIGAALSPSKGNGKASPSKVRKKDAKGTLPLRYYFQSDKKRQNEDSSIDCPIGKVARLSLDDDQGVEVKREAVTPPPQNSVDLTDSSLAQPLRVEMSPVRDDAGTSEAAGREARSPLKVPDCIHVVITEPLVCRRPLAAPQQMSDGPNFKRFKKSHQPNNTGLPRIVRMMTKALAQCPTDCEDEGDENLFFDNAPLPKRRRQR